MNNLRYILRLACRTLAVLLPLVAASCISDDYPAQEKATLRMTVSTRAGNGTTPSDLLESNEHMKTLRVIVARTDGTIISRYYESNIPDGDIEKTITFADLTANAAGEDFDFYAIANEASIGASVDWGSITNISAVKDLTLNGDFLTQVNGADRATTQIPQTAYKRIHVAPQSGGGIQEENMQLSFVVAKAMISITSTTAEEQKVTNLALSGVNTTSTPLFNYTTNGDLDTDNLSTEKDGTVSFSDMTVTGNTSTPEKATAYFFENKGGEYKLAGKWKGDQEITQSNNEQMKTITEIPRGTALDIQINLQADLQLSNFTINISVLPWTERTIDVPAFK